MTRAFRVLLGLLALMALCGGENAFGGTTGKITGQVTDAYGTPLPQASVIVVSAVNRGTLTDEDGVYFLLSMEPGYHTLEARMIGFDSLRVVDVRVTSDMTSNVSFKLKEASIALDEMVVEAVSGSASPGMLYSRGGAPLVEMDKTTSKYVVRGDDIESVPIIRTVTEFVELQAGVTVDEQGDEITIRAGEPEDVAYYLDGISLPTIDHLVPRVYRNFNRLAIQEMTIVTGGMDAEYGHAQGGVVSVVTREAGERFHGIVDYQFVPTGKKHWGENVYDSRMHQGNMHWDDPEWVAESVTLDDGQVVLAHRRLPYTETKGHFLEGNASGPLSESVGLFLSSRWRRESAALPGAYLHTPPNFNSLGKLTWRSGQNVKLRIGGLYDRRKGSFVGLALGGARDLREGGKNLFLHDSTPVGEYWDTDHLLYVGITHLVSQKTFYEVRFSRSVSRRDTVGVWLPDGIAHISEAFPSSLIYDRSGYFLVDYNPVSWDRFSRDRWMMRADVSSQISKKHYLKAGAEVIRYDNWAQVYSSSGPESRFVSWYGKRYDDTDFFPGKQNKGATPIQLGVYAHDKIEMDGMILNGGLRFDALFPNTWVNDPYGFSAPAPMWNTMTRVRLAPQVKGPNISAWSPRLGISHPMGNQSVLRFFYGRSVQMPEFRDLFANLAGSRERSDADLNGNGAIDTAEYWNTFGFANLNFLRGRSMDTHGSRHNPHLFPQTTTTFEVGMDWNFTTDYVMSLTTYYKSANLQRYGGTGIGWLNPEKPKFMLNAGIGNAGQGMFNDTRGLEFSIRKRFSEMFAFQGTLNLQWADTGNTMLGGHQFFPDSLFVANGHYWVAYDIDPTTGAEIPVPLREQALREGRRSEFYIEKFGHSANQTIHNASLLFDLGENSYWIPSWNPEFEHYASEGFSREPGQVDRSSYSERDREFWEMLNSDPDYPGEGEGNVLAISILASTPRDEKSLDRRVFGSLTGLFASPPDFGPFGGRALGNLRANLVYRFYTGVATDDAILYLASQDKALYGPIHTRTDLNIEKRFGSDQAFNMTLSMEVYNMFNQKDVRDTPPEDGRDIDFTATRWQQWGISGLTPTSAAALGSDEIFDVNNYWDQPRECRFSVRLAW